MEGNLPGVKVASMGLPAEEEDVGREVLSSEGEHDSLAHQSFEDALFGWLWILEDSGELLPLTMEWLRHLTVLVIYSCLFKYFHLMLHQATFQIFISS